MKKLLNIFFPEKNENYVKAKLGLRNVKKRFDGFVISFPDVTPNEIMFIKDKWETLPTSISKGVKIMALSFIDNCKSLIIHYESNSYIMPHRHNDEYEFGVVLKGELVDKFSNKKYQVGDKYSFQPNQVHYLSSTTDICIVYSTLSSDSHFLLKPLSKKILKVLELAKCEA